MPTVILLDVSLSMSRPVPTSDSSDTQTRLTIAIAAINSFLDYLTLHAKLEYVALVTYSSGYELAVPFTRDFDSIRTKLTQLEEGDKTCIEVALHGVNQIVLNEWGYQISVQMILITDGNIGVGAIGRNRIIQALPLPPTYPAKIHVLPIAFPNDPSLQHAMPMYQILVDLATVSSSDIPDGMGRGAIYCPDQLTVPSIITTMNRLCEQQYQEFWCSLKCGQLEARVQLFPAPQPACLDVGASLAETIQVVGFLSQQDMGTPIAISKHLVIPQAQSNNTAANRENYGSKTPTKEGSSTDGSATEDDMSDPSKIPNFCVLLHGALKVEGMSAIVQLGPDWWGSVSAWCEAARARRSCLLLSVLRPGAGAAPWLGPLSQLGPADDAASGTPVESFPVRAWRSYTGGGGGSAWARPHALLADVQKVLRHARKLPDKTQHLYKELNRLRRAAISLGFSELLTCVGSALERECAQLPSTAPSECALQLAHAAAALRDPRTVLDIKHTLQPLPTSFTVTSMSH